jgi:iron complex transport system substrate-binding protein
VRALFVLNVQGGRIMVGGKDTSADAILRLAGGHNAAEGISGFRPIGEEAVLELAPEVIVGMRRVSAGAPHDLSQLLTMKGVQATPAGAAKRLVLLDGSYLTSFGPRAPDAARDLMRAFYPELDGADAHK